MKRAYLILIGLIFSHQLIYAQSRTSDSLRSMGYDAYYSEKYQQAITYFSKAIQITPNDTNSYEFRAYAKDNNREYQAALVDYDYLIKLKPTYAAAYLARADLKFKMKNYQGAMNDYDEAFRLDVDMRKVDNYYGRTIRFLTFHQRNNSQSRKSDSLRLLGCIAFYNQKYQQAITYFSKAIQIAPNDTDSYEFRAYSEDNTGEYQAAIVDYDHLIKLRTDYAEAYLARADARFKIKNYQSALLDYEKAFQLDSGLLGIPNYHDQTVQTLNKIKMNSLIKKFPDLGEFHFNISFFSRALKAEINNYAFEKYISQYVTNKTKEEAQSYDTVSKDWDIYSLETEYTLDYKGYPIVIKTEVHKDSTSAITLYVCYLNCECDWFKIQNEASSNGFTLTRKVDSGNQGVNLFYANKNIHINHFRPYDSPFRKFYIWIE